MFLGTPKETNYRINQVPEHCSIGIYLSRCELVYFDAAIEIGLAPNLDRLRQSAGARIAPFSKSSFANSNKPHKNREVLNCSNIYTAVCSRGGVNQMLNKIEESQDTAYQT